MEHKLGERAGFRGVLFGVRSRNKERSMCNGNGFGAESEKRKG
jgi:hypothetical protein